MRRDPEKRPDASQALLLFESLLSSLTTRALNGRIYVLEYSLRARLTLATRRRFNQYLMRPTATISHNGNVPSLSA